MSGSLHAVSAKTAAGCRVALSSLHEGRSGRGVESMLGSLWEPLLFRSTKVANPTVRANATAMLQDAFPLITTGDGSSSGDDDELLQRQFDALRALLGDKDPAVRAAACAAAGSVLSRFWDAIPTATVRVLLRLLLEVAAVDSRSPLVRAAAVDAVTSLLDQPLAHAPLKAGMPGLANLIHDANEKVRVAMCGLLRRVSTVRGIKFTSVVPLEHLTARLKADAAKAQPNGKAPATVSILTRLLVPSYFPTNAPTGDSAEDAENDNGNGGGAPEDKAAAREKLQLGRALTFLKSSPVRRPPVTVFFFFF